MNSDKFFINYVEKNNRREWNKYSTKKYSIDEYNRKYFASVLLKADIVCKKLEFQRKKSDRKLSEKEISFMEKIPHWLID